MTSSSGTPAGTVERLEPRQLFATHFTVSFADPAGTYAAYYNQIRSTLLAAGADWASHFDGAAAAAGGTIDVEVTFNPFVPTAQTRSTTAVTVRTDATGRKVDEQGAAYEVRTGVDPNGAAMDVEVTLGTGYLTGDLWFDPDPAARATGAAIPVPPDKIDAYSVFIHELGHAFAFNGNRDANGTLDAAFGNEESTFDAAEISDGANLYFAGPYTNAAHGGQPVALTRGDAFHVGNASGAGADVVTDLMNGVAFVRGRRYFISDLDLAIAADCGLPVGGRAPVLSVTGGQVAEGPAGTTTAMPFTFTLSAPAATDVILTYTTTDGTAQGGVDYAPAAGTLTIPAGQTSATLPVTVFGDSTIEPDETVSLSVGVLSGAAVVSTPTASGTIVNDDAPAAPAKTLVVTSKKKATYVDAQHQTVTVSLSGPGSATLTFTAATNADADTLVLAGTTAKSALTISSKKATTLRVLADTAAVGSISAKNVSVDNGSVTAAVAKSLSLKTVTGSALALTAPGQVALTVGGLQNATVTAAYLKSVKSTAWTDSTLTVGGLGSLSTTAFTRSTLRSGGTVSSVAATTMTASTIFAAVAAGTTVLPVTMASFTNTTAAIKSLKVSKVFADTVIAAPTLGTVKLPAVNVNDARHPFGLAAAAISSVKASTPAKKKLALSKLSDPTQSYTEGELLIRVL